MNGYIIVLVSWSILSTGFALIAFILLNDCVVRSIELVMENNELREMEYNACTKLIKMAGELAALRRIIADETTDFSDEWKR